MKQINNILKSGLLCLSLLIAGQAVSQTWEMKQAPLMTKWSEEVKANPEQAYTSYPRPQMVREGWVNLNGVWDLAKSKQAKTYFLPTAKQTNNVVWKYRMGGKDFSVSGAWNNALNYDETGWSEGVSGFGKWMENSRTEWETETIYLRKKINIGNLSQAELANLQLEVFHDEDFQLYINGVLAASGVGYITGYQTMDISSEARAAIVLGGENLIAIKCIQVSGWQYIDAGLFIENTTKPYGTYYGDQNFDQKILVPFPVESALSGIMDKDFTDQTKWYTYRRQFSIPSEMAGKDILLHFGAVDWRCKVFVNGTEVGLHEGGYDPFYFNVTSALKGAGNQEVVVQVYDPSSQGGQPRGKQVERPGMIQYTPASGIWQTVWFEGVNQTHIKDFKIVPDIDRNKAIINVTAENATANTKVKITILDKGTEVASTEASLNTNAHLVIANPKLWDTENPFLYDVKFELTNNGQTVDKVDSYFGMRKIALGKVNGIPWVLLNNKPIFQYGVLDQGYWPDGIYSAPNEEALFFDIKKAKEYGFNMIRKHIKTEPAIWYHACDKMGMLVWQDMPNAWEGGNLGDRTYLKNQFYKELTGMMGALKNHPSIVTWVIFNESWGQFDENQNDEHTKEGVRIAKEVDDTRIINSVSGWNDYGIGDLFDKHSYPRPSMYSDGKRASVCGETGGVSLIDESHQWSPPEMEYTKVDNNEQLKDLFINYVEESKGLQAVGLCATVYTQIVDVEMEPNGLLFYDREMKSTPAQVEAMKNAVQSAINYLDVAVVKTANLEEANWKYTTSQPSGAWAASDFNDNDWSTGKNGFGSGNGFPAPDGAVIRTEWNTNDIWLRRNVNLNLSDDEFNNLRALVYYDESFELYINGVLATSATGYSTKYVPFTISSEAKAAINRNGANTIAIHCLQTSGGQYIDAGFNTKVPIASITPEYSSIDENVSDVASIKVYPNPASEMVYVSIEDGVDVKKITLYDINGSTLNTIKGDVRSIDISRLAQGMYILKIDTNVENYMTKIIKK